MFPSSCFRRFFAACLSWSLSRNILLRPCAEHIMADFAPAVTCVTASTNLAPPAIPHRVGTREEATVMAKIWEARGLRLVSARCLGGWRDDFRVKRSLRRAMDPSAQCRQLCSHLSSGSTPPAAGRGRLRAWGRLGAQRL